MAVARGKLEFQNVVSMHTRSVYGDWQERAMQFRAFLLKNNIFITGPIMIQWGEADEETKEAELTIYLPTHQRVQIPEQEIFSYQENFLIADGLKIRHGDMRDDMAVTEKMIGIVAEKAGLKVKKPYYYIYLPVYQEYIVDIFAAVEGEPE